MYSLLKMGIFHCHVSLLECKPLNLCGSKSIDLIGGAKGTDLLVVEKKEDALQTSHDFESNIRKKQTRKARTKLSTDHLNMKGSQSCSAKIS